MSFVGFETDILLVISVLIAVVPWEVYVFFRAVESGITGYAPEIELREYLGRRAVRDIEDRASRGHEPDWQRWDAEMDRTFYVREEHIRTMAGAALVIGIMGTIFALIASSLSAMFFDVGSGTDASLDIVHHLAIALFGSLTGIFVHLLLLLVVLPRAENRFIEARETVREALRRHAEKHPPVLAEVAAMSQSLADAVNSALSSLPSEVTALTIAVAGQTTAFEGLTDALKALTTETQAIKTVSEELVPVSRGLQEAVTQLNTLPETLTAAVQASSVEWGKAFSETSGALQQSVSDVGDRMTTVVSKLDESVGEFGKATGGLDAKFADSAEAFANRFSDRAHEHVVELGNTIEALLLALDEREQAARNRFVDQSSEIATEVLKAALGLLEVRVLGPSQGTSDSLALLVPELIKCADALSVAAELVDRSAPTLERVAERLERVDPGDDLKRMLTAMSAAQATQNGAMARQAEVAQRLLKMRLDTLQRGSGRP